MRGTHMYFALFVFTILVIFSSSGNAAELFNAWADDIPESWKVKVPAGWKEKKLPVEKFRFHPTEQQEEKGLVVFPYHYDSQIYPYSPVNPAVVGKEIRAFASRKEYEPLCFAIHALKGMDNVSLKMGKLSGADGAVLPAKNLDLRFVQMRYRIRGRMALARKQYQRYPGILVKRPEMNMEEGITYPYVLQVYVPEGQPAGIYTGMIQVFCDGTEVDEIPVKLRVLDITLPRAKGAYGYWYGPRFPGQSAPAQMKDMYESGMNFLFNCHLYPKGTPVENGYKLDFNEMDKLVSQMRKSGMTGPVVIDARPLNGYASLYGMKKAGKEIPKRYDIYEIPVEDNKYTKEAFLDMMRQIKLHAKTAKWGKVFVYAQEESSNKAVRMQALNYFSPLIRKAGIERVLVSNATWGGFDEAEGKPGLYKYRSYNLVYDKVLDSIDKQKETLWLFNMPIRRAMLGFYPTKVNAKGISQWAYDWRAAKNPFDPFLVNGRLLGWFYAYPINSRILPTHRTIIFREGIDDIRYIQLLEELAQKINKNGSDEKKQQAISAIESLKARLDEFPAKTTTATEYVKKQSPEYFDTLRWQIAYSILKIMQKDAK